MKLTDYVAQVLRKEGVKHVFAISGGASLHLIHSVARTGGMEVICPGHEQAGAMAADGYARATGGLGVAMSTSGPGATNMITGVCSAYYDSVPVIFITGQVATFRMKGHTNVRQVGFQETATVEMYRPITKYAILITDERRIRYELEKAIFLARSGRPGPVVLDIPDDIQRREINPGELPSFTPSVEKKKAPVDVARSINYLRQAKRPVVVFGWGIHLAGAEKEAISLLETLGFPAALTWGAGDLLPESHPLRIGTFGTHGTRFANFAVQNADMILSIGSRLDTKSTGSPPNTFAREAKKIVIDIDPYELKKFKKFGLKVDVRISGDAKELLKAFQKHAARLPKNDISPWLRRIAAWKKKYPMCPPAYYKEKGVNPYVFVEELSRYTRQNEVMVIDTGCTVAWMMQGFSFKKGQRLYHDWNNTAMGWALPASIGVSLALNKKSIICVTGDGSLQMNLQELSTLLKHKLPIKIFVLNNHGYSMIQQTQDQWFNSAYLASSEGGGLAFPDFAKIASSFGFKTITIKKNRELSGGVKKVLAMRGPVFCNIEINPKHRVIPQVKFGRPLEDPEPLLARKEFNDNMMVKLLPEKK